MFVCDGPGRRNDWNSLWFAHVSCSWGKRWGKRWIGACRLHVCDGFGTLGRLINVDLPWNPSRLEQRLGRIKRFGQVRRTVDMLNLVYHESQDEKVYAVLSRRMIVRFDIFGGLPDTIEDDWIETEEKMDEMMDEYIYLRKKARDVFELRYKETIDPDANRWEHFSRVLARRDVTERLSEPW